MPKLLADIKKKRFLIIFIALIILYLLSRLLFLTILPVFADEAIYIYWSQLIISDWQQFLFYPLNDGKTPLFIWLLIPLLKIFQDPLFAGRLLSVFFGLGQVIITYKIMCFFTSKRFYQFLAPALIILSPGLILTNRLALMDTQLTFFLSASFYFTLLCLNSYFNSSINLFFQQSKKFYFFALSAGIFFGLALMTKLSAILFAPILFFTIFYFSTPKKLFKPSHLKQNFLAVITISIIFILGLSGLYFFKISASFSQLFSRGSDFLFPISEFITRPWTIISQNSITFIRMLTYYLSLPLLLFSFLLLPFSTRRHHHPLLLFFSGMLFLLPIIFLGKIVYPRYLLPALPYFILSFTLSLSYLSANNFQLFKGILLTLIALIGINFIWQSFFSPASMNLDPKDSEQYLQEWSAGYGILSAVNFLEEISSTEKTLVITEGHIGTLPDGLQIYFFNRPTRNQLRIEGLGQAIVNESNLEKFKDLASEYSQAIIIVNSHRMQLNLPSDQLLREFPRPHAQAPTLQIWSWQP